EQHQPGLTGGVKDVDGRAVADVVAAVGPLVVVAKGAAVAVHQLSEVLRVAGQAKHAVAEGAGVVGKLLRAVALGVDADEGQLELLLQRLGQAAHGGNQTRQGGRADIGAVGKTEIDRHRATGKR